MNQVELLREIAKKYKFDNPVPLEIKNKLLKAKKLTLIHILKKYGKYSFFISLVVSFFFWIKKFGLSLSIAKSIVVVGTVSVITAGAVSVSAVYVVKKVIIDKPQPVEKKEEDTKTKKNDTNDISNRTKLPIDYAVAIRPFAFSPNLSSIGNRINTAISSHIISMKGADKAVFSSTAKAPKSIIGSIVKIGNSYFISARLVDSLSSEVLAYITETATSEEDIDRACKTITQKFAGKL